MRRFLLTVTLIFALSCDVFAWSAAGHKFVASIAFARLSPAEQEKVIAILREHSRFKPDYLDKLPSDATDDAAKNEFYFQEMSVWPDVVRGYRGDDAKYNHGTWHYINVPHYLSDSDRDALTGKLKVNSSLTPPGKLIEEMNAIQTIRLSRKMLADTSTSPQDKAIMLAWLFHLVVDIHQPLHSTAIFSPKLFLDGDRGGNRILTVQRRNLHSLWDGLPGNESKLRGAHQEAVKLMTDAELSKSGEIAAGQLDEETWLNESRDLAVSFVYSPELMSYLRNVERESGKDLIPFEFDEGYLRDGGKICDKRVVQAGYRLAAILKQIVEQPLTAFKARTHVNEEVTVQLMVKATKNRLEKRGEIFLDSEEDFRDEKNLGIVVTRTGAAKFLNDGVADPAVHFKGKTIQVHGTDVIKEDRPRIEVDDPRQIQIVDSR